MSDTTPTGPADPGQPPSQVPGNRAGKRLTRSRDDRMLGGVCGGLAAYTGVDATVIRLLAVVGAILGFGSLVLIYIAMWILVPEE
jgi:phage shock protein PspC (stress-responsive transcriptional regulator)